MPSPPHSWPAQEQLIGQSLQGNYVDASPCTNTVRHALAQKRLMALSQQRWAKATHMRQPVQGHFWIEPLYLTFFVNLCARHVIKIYLQCLKFRKKNKRLQAEEMPIIFFLIIHEAPSYFSCSLELFLILLFPQCTLCWDIENSPHFGSMIYSTNHGKNYSTRRKYEKHEKW